MAISEVVKDAAAKTAGGKKEERQGQAPSSESKRLYLLGVGAYAKGDYEEAINYFTKALELDPNNKKAKEGLAKAQQLLEGVTSSKKDSDPLLKGINAYSGGDYNSAAAYFYLALQLDPNDPEAQKNLERAINRGGNVNDGMAALRLQNLPPPLMQMVIAYFKKQGQGKGTGTGGGSKLTTPQAPAKKKKEPTLFASTDTYYVYVNKAKNPNIDRREGIGPTNLDPYVIKKKYEEGAKKTDWEEIIMKKITENHGTYIGALVNNQGKATGVFYITNDGTVHSLTWEIRSVGGDLQLHNGEWLKFTDTPVRNGEFGIYVKKKEEQSTLTKLKKEFEEAGLS